LFDENIFSYAKMHIPQPNTYTFLDNDVSPYNKDDWFYQQAQIGRTR